MWLLRLNCGRSNGEDRLQPRLQAGHAASELWAAHGRLAAARWRFFVFEGDTADPKTLLPQVETVRDRFGIASLIMVGDRGMISSVQIEAMRKMEGVDWITALKSGAIATLVKAGHLQLDLFDERNLISFTSEDYPGERLMACRNPELAKLRAAKRQDLIAATERELQKSRGHGCQRQARRAR